MDLVKEGWEARQRKDLDTSEYVQNMGQHLQRAGKLAQECLRTVQQMQKAMYAIGPRRGPSKLARRS